jgi:tetratricopeptide (TPR) repeat protein
VKHTLELDEIKNKQAIEQINKFLADKENHKALNAVNNLLDKDPTNENAWLYLGIVNRRMGKLDIAIKSFETATDLDNAMIEAWGLLTITYMDKGEHRKAEEIMKTAVELNPLDEKIHFYRDNLIRVYEKFGPFF